MGAWAVLERMQSKTRLDARGGQTATADGRTSVRTLKAWMGATHCLTRTLPRVRTEMSLHVLAYNFKRFLRILGTMKMIHAVRS